MAQGRAAERYRQLLRKARHGALATLDGDNGHPFVSLVAVANDWNGAPLLLLSQLAAHTRNLTADRRVSLLVRDEDATSDNGDLLASARLTVVGTIEMDDDPGVARRYLAWHPSAAQFAEFSDFSYFRIAPDSFHSVAGFGRIETVPAEKVIRPDAGTDALRAAESELLTTLNSDSAGLARLAARRGEDARGDWRATACDPDGAIITSGQRSLRLDLDGTPAQPAEWIAAALAVIDEADERGSFV